MTDTQNHLAQGRAAYATMDLDGARIAYEAAIQADPNDYAAHLGLARTLARMRQQQGATKAATRCIELAPDRPGGYLALGVLQFLVDDLQEAQESLQRGIELAPDDPEGYITLAQVLSDRGEFDAADDELNDAREAIAKLPDEEQPGMQAMAWHAETYVRLAQGKNDEAIEAAHEVIALEEANPYAACLAYSNLGILSARNKKYGQGIEYLERAFATNPFFYRAGSALGRLLIITKQPARAAEVLSQVVQVAPKTTGRDRYAYAVALGRSKQRVEARAQYKLAIAEGLNSMEALGARWQMIWLSEWGRYAVIGVALAAVLGWVLLTQPTGQALVLLPILGVILLLQYFYGRKQ